MSDYDETYDMGVQRHWSDQDIFAYNQPTNTNRGFTPQPNPPPEAQAPQEQFAHQPGVMPPTDSYQYAPKVPKAMPYPINRVISPSVIPTWQGGSLGALPILQSSGTLSPVLSLLGGGIVGYAFGGWKGAAGGALVIAGANNLGVSGSDQPGLHLAAAAAGLGIGGYIVYRLSKGKSVMPNPPRWIRRIK